MSVLLAVAAVFTLAACRPADPALESSGMNSGFPFSRDTTWAAYSRAMTRAIAESRGLGSDPYSRKVLEANRPFELRPAGPPPYRRGIILVHGLTDSPYIMRPLGRHFHERGFLVRGLLLPGHGTRPGDLTTVSLEAWERALAWSVARTAPLVDELYLCGFSTGGGLVCAYALAHPGETKAMLLISPALRIKSFWAFAALPLSLVKKYLIVRDNLDYARYESFALNGAGQVWRLTREIGELGEQAKDAPPAFLVVSGDDAVIDPDYAVDFFSRHLTDPRGRAIVYTDRGHGFRDPRVKTVAAAVPAERIVDYSHLAPPMDPDDPHYGRNGDYRNCYHYPASESRRRCREGKADIRGEVSPANLRKGVVERLTYNPRFREMLADIDAFLERVEK